MNKPRAVPGSCPFSITQAANVTCRKLLRHQELVTVNAIQTRSARLAVTMKHGKAAVITGGSKIFAKSVMILLPV